MFLLAHAATVALRVHGVCAQLILAASGRRSCCCTGRNHRAVIGRVPRTKLVARTKRSVLAGLIVLVWELVIESLAVGRRYSVAVHLYGRRTHCCC